MAMPISAVAFHCTVPVGRQDHLKAKRVRLEHKTEVECRKIAY